MNGFVLVNKGTENVASCELIELIKTKPDVKETIIKFPIKSNLDLCSVCYKSQSISKVVLLLSEFDVEKTLKKTLENFNINSKIKQWSKKKIRVDCKRVGEHKFNSVDISAGISKKLIKETKVEIDYDSPDIIFFIYVYKNLAYFGVDFSGIDLSKRQYKIFQHPESLKGTTAYSLLRMSEYNKKDMIIDPFMGSGMIIIEAALYNLNFPVHYYSKERLAFTNYEFFKKDSLKFFEKHDKLIKKNTTKIYGYDNQLRFLKATQKNAKMAGIDKSLILSKIDVELLDTKFEKNSVDKIITDAPRVSKHKDLKKLGKIYHEFFYQSAYVLKKQGTISVLTRDFKLLEENAKKHKFKITKKYLINQGKDEFNFIIFKQVE